MPNNLREIGAEVGDTVHRKQWKYTMNVLEDSFDKWVYNDYILVDFMDGEWHHTWNWNKLPVEPETIVEVILMEGPNTTGKAEEFYWDMGKLEWKTNFMVVLAFRVIKENK